MTPADITLIAILIAAILAIGSFVIGWMSCQMSRADKDAEAAVNAEKMASIGRALTRAGFPDSDDDDALTESECINELHDSLVAARGKLDRISQFAKEQQ